MRENLKQNIILGRINVKYQQSCHCEGDLFTAFMLIQNKHFFYFFFLKKINFKFSLISLNE